jgi:hypothetical protein
VNSALKFPTVITNDGGAFNPSNSEFVAPYNATYYFIATTWVASSTAYANMALMVDNTEINRVDTIASEHPPASVHGVVRLNQHQRVWIKVLDSPNYFAAYDTAFSGFLIYS